MKKKKNKYSKYTMLIILLVFVAVLSIAYRALSASNDKKEAQQAAEEAAANAVQMIAEYDASNATELSYKRPDEDPIAFYISGATWYLKADDNFPLNQTPVTAMASAISSIGVKSEITDGEAANFGLEEPEYLINVTYADGTSHEYRIGDYNSFDGGSYYFMADGAIYTISSGLSIYFDYELDDLLQLDSMPTDIEQDYITGITVMYEGREKTIDDVNGIAALFDIFGDLSLTTCSDYYSDEAERAELYNIDGSSGITISYKRAVTTTDANGNETTNRLDTAYTFLFGSSSGHDEGYYAAPEKSTIVYVVDAETVDKIIAYLDYEPAPEEE